jgi:chaperonin cofactor prefoldin
MRKIVQIISILAVIALAGVPAGPSDSSALAQQGTVPAKSGPKAKAKQPLTITPEREAAALNFVERNHAELTGLLAHLKTDQPKQYEQAIKEIFRVTERLAGVQERDPLLYELEVKLWTAQSRVQLLAARLKMGTSEGLKDELREALAEQIDARLAVLKHQKQQAAERLAKMEADLRQLEANKEQAIERQLEVLARGGGNKNVTKAPGVKPAKRAEKTTTKTIE